jgi:hypothetical protein
MTNGTHDRALKALQGAGPELRNGAPNHAPMVVETLAGMGREDAVPQRIEGHRRRLAEGPETEAIIGADLNAALGDFAQVGEWQNVFRAELQRSFWRDVLERWLPHLIPGSMATGTHGIIRCGHASCALENEVTGLRLEELAAALAYCAARHRPIGGTPLLAGPLRLQAAVRELPCSSPRLTDEAL